MLITIEKKIIQTKLRNRMEKKNKKYREDGRSPSDEEVLGQLCSMGLSIGRQQVIILVCRDF